MISDGSWENQINFYRVEDDPYCFANDEIWKYLKKKQKYRKVCLKNCDFKLIDWFKKTNKMYHEKTIVIELI